MPSHPTKAAADQTHSLAEPGVTTGGDTAAAHVTPLPPTAANRYTLGEEIARGGMGAVYRATDTTLDREVAVKVLLERYAPDSGTARRFHDEACITGQLQHPGVPPVHDLGTLPDGRPFLAMKLIKGRTLAELLASRASDGTGSGTLPPIHTGGSPSFVAAFEQVCHAVAFAHAHGIVHRDLKPANVMVGDFGEVQVMDWGLAKVLASGGPHPSEAGPEVDPEPSAITDPDRTTDHRPHEESTDDRTRAGQVMGTPAYMPPEQARGEIAAVDRRSDVFALGGILCAVLTGKPPFTGATAAEVTRRAASADLTDAFARLDACDAEAELVALCKRCLSPHPDDRPMDAAQVAGLVAEWRTAADERARQAERDRIRAEAEAREQRKRRRVQLALAAAVGLLLVGGVAAAWWQDQQSVAAANRQRDEQERLGRNAAALAALVGQCEAALQADDTNGPAAAAALAEIDRRLPEGGGDELLGRIDRCRTTLAMLDEFDALDRHRWTPINSRRPRGKDLAQRWPVGFARAGLDLSKHPAEMIADRIADSLIRIRLIATLDNWLILAPTPQVRAVLRLADPDPYRDAVRDALATRSAHQVAELCEQQALAAQPPGFVAALGQYDQLPAERRRQMLEAALIGRPGNLVLLMSLGRTYPLDSRIGTQQRVRWYQAAVAAHPQNQMARLLLSWAHKDAGELDTAAAVIRQTLEIDRTYSVGYELLAQIHTRKGNPDAALAAFRDAVRLEPDNPEYLMNLGVALRDRGQIEEAVAVLKEGIRVAPQDPWCYTALGELQRDRGDPNTAIATFNKAIEFAPNFTWAYSGLGLALSDKGDQKAGRELCEKAVRLAPDFAPSYINLAIVLYRIGDHQAVLTACREALRLDPDQDGPDALIVAGLLGLNRPREAVTAARKGLVDRPKNANSGHLHFHLASALMQTGDYVGARAAAARAAAIDPRQFGLHPVNFWPLDVAPAPRQTKQ